MMCFLCKSNKNMDYLKSFIIDLIVTHDSTMPFLFQNLVLLFARIWPEALTWPCSALDTISHFDEDFEIIMRKNPILLVVIYIIKESIYKNNQKLDSTSSKSKIKHIEYSPYYVHVKNLKPKPLRCPKP